MPLWRNYDSPVLNSRMIVALLVALTLVGAACGVSRDSAADDGATDDGATEGTVVDGTETVPPATVPQGQELDLSIIGDTAATITFANGTEAEVPGSEVIDILGQLVENEEAATLLFGQPVASGFLQDTLSSLIQLRILDRTIDDLGGSVPAGAEEEQASEIDAQLLQAMASEADPASAAAIVKEGASAYLELIVSQRVRQNAITAEFLDGDDVTNPCSRHILVETEAEADAIIVRLDGGEDFAELAAELSTGPSGPNGGDLGCTDPAGFVEAFQNAILDGELNEILGPIETEFGFHVIEVYDFETAPADPSAAESEGFARFSTVLEGSTIEVAEALGSWDPVQTRVVPAAAE